MRAAGIALAVVAPLAARADTAVRVGVTRESSHGVPAAGNGVFIDSELAWRYAPSGSVGVFAAASASDVSGDVSCTVGATPVNMTEHYDSHPVHVELGARTTFHSSAGLFIGIGLGVDVSSPGQSVSGGMCFATPGAAVAPLVEFHAGLTFPDLAACSGCAIQLFVVANAAPALQTEAEGSASLRLAIGMRFH